MNKALSLDGYRNLVEISNFDNFPTTELTIQGFFKREVSGTDETPLFSYAVEGENNEFLLSADEDTGGGELYFLIGGNRVETGVTIPDSEWHHWAVSYDSSTGVVSLYRDGENVFSHTDTSLPELTSGGSLVFGQEQDSVGGGFNPSQVYGGLVDEVSIWNRVLSAEEIANNRYTALTGNEDNLVSYYKFADISNDIVDETSNNNGLFYTDRNFVSSEDEVLGTALSLNGVDEYVVTDLRQEGFFEGGFKVETWFKTTDSSGVLITDRFDYSSANSGQDLTWQIRLSSGEIQAETKIFTVDGTRIATGNSTQKFNDGKWHKVELIFSELSDGIRKVELLIDDAVEDTFYTQDQGSGFARQDRSRQLVIGGDDSGDYYRGYIGEVKVSAIEGLGDTLNSTPLEEVDLTSLKEIDSPVNVHYDFENDNNGTLNGRSQAIQVRSENSTSTYLNSFNNNATGIEFRQYAPDNSYVEVPDFNNFPTTAITLEGRFESFNDLASNSPAYFSYAVGTEDNNELLLQAENGEFVVFLKGEKLSTNVNVPPRYEESHIALTWSSETNEDDQNLFLYDDGEEIYAGKLAAGATIQSGGSFILGQEQDSVGGSFEDREEFLGNIDDVRIWNTVRTQQEIQANYQKTLAGNEPGLVTQINFDDILDKSGNNNNAFFDFSENDTRPLSDSFPPSFLTVSVSDFTSSIDEGKVYLPAAESDIPESIPYVELSFNQPVSDAPGLIINYEVTGTATLGEDFYISQTDLSTTDDSPPTNSIFIPQGADSTKIYIAALPDAIDEGTETINITLQPETVFGEFGSGLENNLFIEGNPTVTLNLEDSENYTAGIAIVDAFEQQVTADNPLVSKEGESTFQVKLTSQPTQSVQITLNTGQGTLSSSELTFDGTNWDTYQEVTVNDLDSINDPFEISANAVSDDSTYGGLSETISVVDTSNKAKVRVTEGGEKQPIAPPEVSLVTVRDATEGETEPGRFSVTLDRPAPAGGLTVQYTISAENAVSGEDFEVLPSNGIVEIAPGERSASIAVSVTDDDLDNTPNRTVTVNLATSEGYTLSSENQSAVLNLVDDDQAGIEVVRLSNLGEINISDADAELLDVGIQQGSFSPTATGAEATVQIDLNQQPTANVEVTLTDPNNTSVSNTLTFTPDNWETPQELSLNLTKASNGSLALEANTSSSDSVYQNQTISLPFAQQAIPTDRLLTEEGDRETFAVRLTSQPTEPVTLAVSTLEGSSDLLDLFSSNLEFNPDNWDNYQTVELQAKDNDIDSNSEEGAITGRITVQDTTGYTTASPTVEIVIEDDDNLSGEEEPTPLENNSNILASLTPTTTQFNEEGGTAQFQVTLNQPAPSGGLVVKYQLSEQSATAGLDFVNQFQLGSADENPFSDLTQNLRFSAPTFVNLDEDSDLELMVGHTNGIAYYDKVSDTTSYQPAENPLADLNDSNLRNFMPAFADIDGDGDQDAFIGSSKQKLTFYRNDGNDEGTFNVQEGIVIIPNSRNNSPALGDLDNDGIPELLLGNPSGTLRYFKLDQLNENGNPIFSEQTGADNPFSFINVAADSNSISSNAIANSVPTLFDADQDGDLDLFVGERSGVINYYVNVGTDDNGNLTFIEQQGSDVPLGEIKVPSGYSKVAFTDFDLDNDADAFTGRNNGGLVLYENTGIGTAFIPENQDTATIEIQALSDQIAEVDETFGVRLVENPGQQNSYRLSDPVDIVVTSIERNDNGEISSLALQLNESDVASIVLESGTTLRFGNDTFFTIENTTEIVTDTATSINVPSNALVESDTNPLEVDAVASYETNSFSATATIIDDDTASVKITTDAAGNNEISADDTFETQEDNPNSQQTFYVSLTSEPTAPVEVYLGSSNVDQGKFSSENDETQDVTRLVFTANNWNQPQGFTVVPINNDIDEGDVSYEIITTVNSEDTQYQAENLAPQLNLIDTDAADVADVIVQATGTATAEGVSNNFYNVQLATQPLGEVFVTMTPGDNEIELDNELAGEPLTVTFNENNWNIPRTVEVTAVDDSEVEYQQITNVAFDISSSDDSTYDTLTPTADLDIVVEDNDLPLVSIESVAAAIEAGAPGYFVITLDQPAPDAFGETGLIVNYSFGGTADLDVSSQAPASDLQPLSGSARIAPGEIHSNLIAFPIDDFIAEGVDLEVISDYDSTGDTAINLRINAEDLLVESAYSAESGTVGLKLNTTNTETKQTAILSEGIELLFSNGAVATVTETTVVDNQGQILVPVNLDSGTISNGETGFRQFTLPQGSELTFGDSSSITVNSDTPITSESQGISVPVTVPDDVGQVSIPANELVRLPGETVTVSLESGERYTIDPSGESSASLEIIDNDTPGVRIVETGDITTVTENETTEMFVSLLSQPEADVTVKLLPPVLTAKQLTVATAYDGNTGTVGLEITEGSDITSLVLPVGKEITFGNGVKVRVTEEALLDSSIPSEATTDVAVELIEGDTLSVGETGDYIYQEYAYQGANPDDGSLSFTFNSDNWYQLQKVTIEGIDDNVVEKNKFHTSTIEYEVDSVDPGYNGLEVAPSALKIIDRTFDKDNTINSFSQGFLTLQDSLDNLTLPILGNLEGTAPDFIKVFTSNLTEELRNTETITYETLTDALNVSLEDAIAEEAGVSNTEISVEVTDLSSNNIAFLVDISADYTAFSIPLGADLGLSALGIGLETEGGLESNFTYDFSLGFGIGDTDEEDGIDEQEFYINTEETAFSVGASLGLSDDFRAVGNLGFLRREFANGDPESEVGSTGVNADLVVTLANPDDPEDTTLTLSEIQTNRNRDESLFDFIQYGVSGNAALNLDIITSIAGDAAFPSFSANLASELPIFNYANQEQANEADPVTLTLQNVPSSLNEGIVYNIVVSAEGTDSAIHLPQGTQLTVADKTIVVDRTFTLVPSLEESASMAVTVPRRTSFSNTTGLTASLESSGFNIAFNDITLDLGTFITDILSPVIEFTDEVLSPIKPVIDALTADIGFLSTVGLANGFDQDGDGEASLIEIAVALSASSEDSRYTGFVNAVTGIIGLVDALETLQESIEDNGAIAIDFGDYTLENFTAASQTTSASEVNVETGGTNNLTSAEEIKNQSRNPNTRTRRLSNSINNFLGKLDELGVSIPLLDNPLNAIKLFLGQDIDLVTYDIPDLSVGFGMERIFPIYPPLFGALEGSFNAETDLEIGFDTHGFSLWQDTGFNVSDSHLTLDGFYLNDLDDNGADKSELVVEALIAAAAELNVVVASGSVQGGIRGTAGLDVIDIGEYNGSSDGRIRSSEILSRITNPSSLFELTGEIEAFIKAVVKVGVDVGLFEVTKTVYDQVLVNQTLFEFSVGGSGKGRVVQNYIEGGQVFFDANFNGQLDEGEPVTFTAADGSYDLDIPLAVFDTNQNGQLDETEGRLVSTGGIDPASGVTISSPLYASSNSSVITPLTGMKQQLMEDGMDSESAAQAVKKALGLPENVDLDNFDPIIAVEQGNAEGVPVYSSHIKIQSLVSLTERFFASFAETNGLTVDFNLSERISEILSKEIGSGGLTPDIWKEPDQLLEIYQPAGEVYESGLSLIIAELIPNPDDLPLEEEVLKLLDAWATTVSTGFKAVDKAVAETESNAELDSAIESLNPVKTYAEEDLVELMDDMGSGQASAGEVKTKLGFKIETVPAFKPSTPGRIIAEFNQQINPALLNLYDGQDAKDDQPVYSVVGQNAGNVRGSLVWDEATNRLEWIKTGGILEPDTYTLRMSNSKFSLVESEDYTDTFTVEANTDPIVSLPDFTRAPGQIVDVPANDELTGLPISIQNPDGVRDVELTLSYNPDLLSVNGINLNPDLPASWQVDSSDIDPINGIVNVSLSGSDSLTEGGLLLLDAEVPDTATYGASQIVRFDELVFNSGNLSGLADDALHQVAYFGDLTGNGDYSGLDASLIARIAVGLDTGSDAYPMTDPIILGDTTGNGQLSGLDASFVARKAVGLPQPEIPNS